jgi:hypothetical protein
MNPVREVVRLRRARTQLPVQTTGNPAVEIFLWSRAAIWSAAVLAASLLAPNPRAGTWDRPALTHDLGLFTDVWARWDSVFFLRIAEHGYQAGSDPAFFPLYPALVGIGGRALGGHYVLAGVVVSLVACLGALVLLYRLAESRLGAEGGRRAVLYVALFPTALFLQAVYSESLFLLLAVAVFAFAERGRFLEASTAAGLALLTRPAGLALLPPLLLLAARSDRRVRSLASLALAPALFAAYPLVLWLETGRPWAFASAQGLWHRHLSAMGPLSGIWDGLRAGFAGIEQLVSGSHTHRYWKPVHDLDPMRVAVLNLEMLAFLMLFAVLAVVVWRRFGAPYGLFAVGSLALPLSVPSEHWPLLSIPRFGLVVFPFFLALAVLGRTARIHTAIVAVSSLLLGVAVTEWSLWYWVA